MIRSTPSADLMDRGEAEAVGIEALGFLAADPRHLSRFLALTGIEPHEMRGRAADPAFFAGLLDFLLGHEPTLLAFAETSGIGAERVVAARRALDPAFAATPR